MAEADFPVDDVLESLKQMLRNHSRGILIAQPGAGKTTRVPIALLDEPWLAGKRIIMLEPRRLSTRSAALFMARRLGEKVGETVGYRIRNETIVGPRTRIEIVTEGVLTRMLLSDPILADAGLVIFDEFHERNLHADTGLALCLQSQSLFETGMKILLMSATMEKENVSIWFDAPVIESEGRMFPVETRYLDNPIVGDIENAIVRAVQYAVANETGDLLVFLPGIAQIRNVQAALIDKYGNDLAIYPLYGEMSVEKQDQALQREETGKRKVVLSTPIAETGLTIEGIRVVIDSGLVRIPKFSPKTGLSHLVTETVSKASADQRRGRAGRMEPGVCYRMWTKAEDERLKPHRTPEIAYSDLAGTALALAEWGARPEQLKWLTPSPSAHYEQAEQLLVQLGALQAPGMITDHGRHILQLGIQPRLAHMILKMVPCGLGGLACDIAALLSERDMMKGDKAQQIDIRYRADLINNSSGYESLSGDVDITLLNRIKTDAMRLKRLFGIDLDGRSETNLAGLSISLAYPDRIGMNRGGGKFTLSNGRGAYVPSDQPMMNEPFIAVAQLDGAGSDSRIIMAAPVSIDELLEYHHEAITESEEIDFDESGLLVKAHRVVRLGALKIKETPIANADKDLIAKALLEGIARIGLQSLPWDRSSMQLRARIATIRMFDTSWPDVSDDGLLMTLNVWLAPSIIGFRQLSELKRLPLHEAISSMLDWEQRRRLDMLAPTHLIVPSGSKIAIDYSDPSAPSIAVRLQEMFGLTETPRIADGKLPLTIRLLSPAMRPVQITRDLASFWNDAYYEVKKDLKGRYPKHVWPDNPLEATATNRTKPRS